MLSTSTRRTEIHLPLICGVLSEEQEMGISVSVSMQKGMETQVTTLGSGVAFLKIEMRTSI